MVNGAENIVALLKANNLTLATCESCTGGAVGEAITSIPGSSEVFLGGIISYSNDVKKNIVGVEGEALEKFGAVSAEVARQMADGARALLKSDIAISVTGIAGPGGGSSEKPVGLVWFGLSRRDSTTRCEKCLFQGDRATIRRNAVQHALGMIQIAAVI